MSMISANRKIRRRGATLLEVMTASMLTLLVLGSVLAVMYSGMRSWVSGQGHIEAEMDGSQAIRRLAMELREAMAVTVASDGQSLTYRLPRRNASGAFSVPAEWDGVMRRVVTESLGGGRFALRIGIAGSETTLTRNLILTDPNLTGNPTYRVFTPGAGTITRQLQIRLVTRTTGYRGVPVHHRVDEMLFLRNIPSLTQ